MALGFSQKTMTVHNGLPKAPMIGTKSRGDLDFDLLVTHVEDTIHDDKHNKQYGITPQELMMRSNPALYHVDNPSHRDLANPREVYSILSHKSKSIEDLTAKLKQELARSVQTTGTLPKLSRALSMNDISHKPADKANRLGNKHESHGITSNPRRKVNLVALKQHNTSGNETRKTTENKPLLNLPSIDEKGVRHEEKGVRQGDLNTKFRHRSELDQLTERTECDDKDNAAVIKRVEFSGINDNRVIDEEKEQITRQDAKLNKWFSEMPNEVFDKAQRALMEESIKDKLQDFQKRRRKKHAEFPHQTFHVCVGPKARKVPNTYLELRVDSFGRHIQPEKDEKMTKYKLQQKSMHNLKMRESSDMDLYDRIHREETFPKLLIQNRSLTTLTGTKLKKLDPEPPQIVAPPKKAFSFRADGGFKTVYINDAIGTDLVQNTKLKHGHNNYEEYTERLVMMKELAIDLSNIESTHRLYHQGDYAEKDASKAAIVNLTLGQDGPKQRKSQNLEKSIKDANVDNALPIVEREDSKVEDFVENETEEEKPIPDKMITKIPTAQSVRTSDTRSSNSSILSRSNKEALKKFNKLEVFAESKPFNDGMPARDIFTKGKAQTSGEFVPVPPTKPDTKPQKRFVRGNSDAIMLPEPPKKHEPEVMFRFEPGEVFIQRKAPLPSHTSTRCSERARIIYGKTTQGNNDKMSSDRQPKTIKKKDTNTGTSAMTKSTRLDRFKSEISQYEIRALNESPGTISPRPEDGAKNKTLIVTSSQDQERPMDLRLTRDVATETDLLGSIKDSKSQVSAEDKQDMFYNTDIVEVRSDCELSDFIVENNDGESLESDDDDTSDVIRHQIQSTMSV